MMKAFKVSADLRVTEIYRSLQGESTYAGLPCSFVRLTGCPLRCRWCDSAYAFEGGEIKSISQVVKEVKALGVPLVELTGGEPMAQAGAVPLMQTLLDEGFQVLIETGGSEAIDAIPPEVRIILDVKCPGSRMEGRNHWQNLEKLRPHDEVKFVIASKEDFVWAKDVVEKYRLNLRNTVLFSPAFGLVKPRDLAAWILEENTPVRMQIQQHKYIWDPKAKGV